GGGGAFGGIVNPPELTFLRALWMGASTRPPADERTAVATLRAIIPDVASRDWSNDTYPLVHAGSSRAAARRHDQPPDVIVLAIESLRARELGYGLTPPATSAPPALDALAARGGGVTPYIANDLPD